jgi:hypothetical protein
MNTVKEILTKYKAFSGLLLLGLPILAAPAPPPLGIFVAGGKLGGFVLLAIVFVFGYIFIVQAERGTKFPIRTIAGFEAIKDAVGRSVEMGRPIHYTFGYGNLYTSMAPQFTAGLNVLGYVSRLAGQYGARVITTFGVPEAIPMAEETVREGYRIGGKPEMYRHEDVRYLTSEQFAYASAVQATINRERAAANIMVGPFYAESLIFAETGATTGSVQIAGTARETQIPFFVLVCDYVLIGEEMFAASALATGDAATAATLGAEDVGKVISVVLLLLGLGLLQIGVKLAPLLLT